MKCEVGIVKYLLITFCLIFAITGIGLIVAGSLVYGDIGEFSHFMEEKLLASPIVLIVAGIIVLAVAFLGCYGAIKESYLMLMGFAVCLLVIFVVELAVGITAAVYKSDFEMGLKDLMKKSLNKYDDNILDKIAWDNMQSKLECCGVFGPYDWPKGQRPKSCCHSVREDADPPQDFHCKQAEPLDKILFSYGCFQKLQMRAKSASNTLIGVGIGISFVEIIGIALACWLASAIKNKN